MLQGLPPLPSMGINFFGKKSKMNRIEENTNRICFISMVLKLFQYDGLIQNTFAYRHSLLAYQKNTQIHI